MIRGWLVTGSLVVGACGPTVGLPSAETESSDDGPTATSISTSTSTTTSPPPPTGQPTSGLPTATADGESSDADDSPGIWDCGSGAPPGTSHHCTAPAPDMPAPDCDLLAQDCPAGDKCNPFGSGTHWNGSDCVGIEPESAGPGEACVIDGRPLGGHDDCELGAWCVPSTADSTTGVCWPMCSLGPADEAVCDSGICASLFDDLIPVCVQECDPTVQDCAAGRCDAAGEAFACVPGIGAGAPPGAACSFAGDCQAGTTCVEGISLPACGAEACCASFCSSLDADPDAACTGGAVCTEWYVAGLAPPGYEHVGVCGLP